ncbi:AAA family ATPase [archaeon]|nr:AAA family ATPase [archaeon]
MWDYEPHIIKDEKPLLDAFIPEHIVHREGQKQLLASCLKPTLAGHKATNIFIYGPCGTGKTMLTNWTLNELRAHSSKVSSAYVNCWKHNTAHATLTKILHELGVFTTYHQAVHELLAHVEKEIKDTKLIVCLDEVDVLETKDLLYDLSRAGIGLVLISNDPYALMDLDMRIKSSLQPETLEFPAYKTDEILDILLQRKPYAFVGGTIKEKDLKLAARLANGDTRIALETVRRAALNAEEKGEERVSSEHIKEAFKKTGNLRKTEALKRLNNHEKTLYLILKEYKKMPTKDLFNEYTKRIDKPATDRSYRNYMNKLVRLGLVNGKGKLTGRIYEILI